MESAIERREQTAVPEVPYQPSWVDQFTDWVERLPIPWWSFYILLALGLSGAVALLLWQVGVYTSFGFHPMQVWLPALVAFPHGLGGPGQLSMDLSHGPPGDDRPEHRGHRSGKGLHLAWAPGTLRGLLGTVLLPVVLWLIQRTLGNLLG